MTQAAHRDIRPRHHRLFVHPLPERYRSSDGDRYARDAAVRRQGALAVLEREVHSRRREGRRFHRRGSNRRESRIANDELFARQARARGIPLVSDIEMFLDHARAPVVGITGTNGKSTVTALTGELLRDAGLNVGVGGNLGEAALDLLESGARRVRARTVQFSARTTERRAIRDCGESERDAGSSRPISGYGRVCGEQAAHLRRLRRCDIQQGRPFDGTAGGGWSSRVGRTRRPCAEWLGNRRAGRQTISLRVRSTVRSGRFTRHPRPTQRIQRAGVDGSRARGGRDHGDVAEDTAAISKGWTTAVRRLRSSTESRSSTTRKPRISVRAWRRSKVLGEPRKNIVSDCRRRRQERRSFAVARTDFEVRSSRRDARQGRGGGRIGDCGRRPVQRVATLREAVRQSRGRSRAAAISCCCRRPARASTCSRTSRRVAANSPRRSGSLRNDARMGLHARHAVARRGDGRLRHGCVGVLSAGYFTTARRRRS